MNIHSPHFTPISRPQTSRIPSLSNPSQFRAQTANNPRPILKITTRSQTNIDGPKSHVKKGPLNLSKIQTGSINTMATMATVHDSLTTTSLRSKTPLESVRKLLNRGVSIENKSKMPFTAGILDLTSVHTLNTQTSLENWGTNTSHDSPYQLMTNRSKKDGKSTLRIERKEDPKDNYIKIADLVPFKMQKLPSRYEKSSIMGEREIREYISKLKIIDKADLRKLKTGGRGLEIMELAMRTKEQAMAVPGLTNEEKNKIKSFDIEDEDLFKKVELVLIENLRRIEKLERINQVVGTLNSFQDLKPNYEL